MFLFLFLFGYSDFKFKKRLTFFWKSRSSLCFPLRCCPNFNIWFLRLLLIASFSAERRRRARASADNRGIFESDYAPNALVDWSVRRRSVQRFKSSEFLRSERTKRERERHNERQLNGSFFNYDRKYMVKIGQRKPPHRAQNRGCFEISLLNQRIPSYWESRHVSYESDNYPRS